MNLTNNFKSDLFCNKFSKIFDVEAICADIIDNEHFDVYFGLSCSYHKEYWVLHVDKTKLNCKGFLKGGRKSQYVFESVDVLPPEVVDFIDMTLPIHDYEKLIEVDKYLFSGDISKLNNAGFTHIPSIREGFWVYRFKVNNHGRFSAYFTIELDTSKEDKSLKWDCCDIDGFCQWVPSLNRNEIDKINEKLKILKQEGVLVHV